MVATSQHHQMTVNVKTCPPMHDTKTKEYTPTVDIFETNFSTVAPISTFPLYVKYVTYYAQNSVSDKG